VSIVTRMRITLIILAGAIVLVVGVWNLYSIQQIGTAALEQNAADFNVRQFQGTALRTVLSQLLAIITVVVLIVTVVATHLARRISSPIQQLVEATKRVADGDYRPIQLTKRDDDIGELAVSFEWMTAELEDLVTKLQARTDELGQRAAELAQNDRQNQRRATQLEASAQVASAIASTLDLEELLHQITRLIADRFNWYHCGVFLLDDTGHWAVLRAANSDGGQRMLARGHRLEVGRQGIVGNVTRLGQPRIVNNVGVAGDFFDNPHLPQTRSELVLPLIARDQIIGALDVQSVEELAFDQEDVAVLGILANQVAIAIDNARLYAASQAALNQLQLVLQQYTADSWREYTKNNESVWFHCRQDAADLDDREPLPIPERVLLKGITTATSPRNGQTALIAPIKVRGAVIGALGLHRVCENGRQVWSDDEVKLVETVADQVAQAMEAARLYEEAQQRARHERLVTEIAGKIQSAPDIDSIMRTAVQEIRRTLGVSHGIIRLGTETHLKPSHIQDGIRGTEGARGYTDE
jgi:GAF domain-containing protein/HAMP domain-containing protein